MPSKSTPDRFLNYTEVAELIGLPVKTLRNREAGTKDIPRIKLGRRVVFSFNAVQAWMRQKAREAEEAQRRAKTTVIDLLAEKRQRSWKKDVEDTLTTIINGGRYK